VFIPSFSLRGAVRDFKKGVANRFPLCCVIQYTIDQFLGIKSAHARGGVKHGDTEYVPCLNHKRRSSYTSWDAKFDCENIFDIQIHYTPSWHFKNFQSKNQL
jgi:hypothetical protein